MTPQTGPDVHERSILDYVHIVLRHWLLIILVCIPSVAAAVAWSFVVTETYRATASIVPPLDSMQGGDLGLAGGLMSGEGAFLRKAVNVTSAVDLYVGILGSQAVLDAIVDRFNLMQVYECPECRWVAVDCLKGNTSIKVGDDGIVQISVVDRDPIRAAAVANAYVEELDRQNKRLSSGQATSKRQFLENRLKEIEQKFSRIETIPAHEAKVQEMLYELLIREYELAKMEEAKSMPTIQVLDPAVPPQQKFEPQRSAIVMRAAGGSFAAAVCLAFFLEYRRETKQGGLAQQFQRATRWKRKGTGVDLSVKLGDDGKQEMATTGASGLR